MEINLEMLKARASDVEEAVKKIRIYVDLSDEVFWQDERNLFTVKYLLLQAMEAIGSICVHVLAKEFQVPVSSYAACFERLGEKGVIPSHLSAKLRKMIRFRNILVHRYREVDDKKVIQYARQDVQDFVEMLKAIWNFLRIGK
jgi:uncharacterized protein YutE (UPF0331/DUF86 family)